MKDEIYLNDSFEIFEKIIFSSYIYHQDAGLKTLEEWKERNLKISTAIKLAIEQNLLHTDKIHKNNILFQINRLIENINNAKDFDYLSNEITIKLTKIIFLLLGDIPDNWDKKSKSLPKKWKLNRHRTLKYIITDRKKSLIIFKYLYKAWSNKEKVQILHEKLTLEMNSDYKQFNKWFKENHIEIYDHLFEY